MKLIGMLDSPYVRRVAIQAFPPTGPGVSPPSP